MPFDVNAARKAGHTDSEIADFLAQHEPAVAELAAKVVKAVVDLAAVAQQESAKTGEIGDTLAGLLKLLRARKEPAPAAPEITVNVPAAPAPQIAVFQSESDYEVDHEYDSSGRLVKSYVKRVSKGE